MRPRYSTVGFFLAVWLLAPQGWGQDRVWMPPPLEFRLETPVGPQQDEIRKITAGLTVDTSNRADVVDFYYNVFMASEGVNAEWNGSIPQCIPGTTSLSYEEATLLRVNYYRAMAGLPADITFSSDWNTKCQEAALIFIAEPGLSHYPPDTWACWTQGGYEAAGHSNIAIGAAGPLAIRNYIYDFAGDGSSHNSQVGHRRWILYPPQQVMGAGSTTARNGYYTGSNALWVTSGFGTRPSQPEWVAWPPEGFVPYQIVDPNIVFFSGMTPENPRFSFSSYGADFSAATVTMTESGNPVTLEVVNRQNGFVMPDATIVWEPEGLPRDEPPPRDTTYTITISGVEDRYHRTREFIYTVTIIDPAAPPPPSPTPTAAPTVQATPTPTPTWTETPTATATLTPTPSMPGDVNGDGAVDHLDLFLLAGCWGTADGQNRFNPACDLDGDFEIFHGDVFEILQNW